MDDKLIEQEHDGMAVDSWSVPMLDFDYSNEQPDIEATYSEYEIAN